VSAGLLQNVNSVAHLTACALNHCDWLLHWHGVQGMPLWLLLYGGELCFATAWHQSSHNVTICHSNKRKVNNVATYAHPRLLYSSKPTTPDYNMSVSCQPRLHSILIDSLKAGPVGVVDTCAAKMCTFPCGRQCPAFLWMGLHACSKALCFLTGQWACWLHTACRCSLAGHQDRCPTSIYLSI